MCWSLSQGLISVLTSSLTHKVDAQTRAAYNGGQTVTEFQTDFELKRFLRPQSRLHKLFSLSCFSRLQATSTVDTAATSPTWTSSVKTATLSLRVGKTQASCSGGSFSPRGIPRRQTHVPLGHCDFCFVYRLLTNLRKTVPLPVTLVGEPVRVIPDKQFCVHFCYIGQDRMHVG